MTGIHPITIGANTVIHLRSKLNSAYGTIAIGEGCIIGERAVVGLLGEGGKGVVIGKGVVLEAGARVEGNLGDGSVVEAGGIVGRGAVVGKVGRSLILLFLESITYISLTCSWNLCRWEAVPFRSFPYTYHMTPLLYY